MREVLLAWIGMSVLAGTAWADGERFIRSAWLCVSPEAHAEAVATSGGGEGPGFEELKARLLAEKKCAYLPRQDFVKVLTSVLIVEARGNLVRVKFSLQEGDNRPRDVRHEVHYRMLVWTARDNLSLGDEPGQQ